MVVSKFLIVGGIGALGYIALSYFIVFIGVTPWLSSFTAYLLSIPAVFFMQRYFVFKGISANLNTFLKYLATQLFGLGLSAILPLFLELFSIPSVLSFISVSVTSAFISYLLQSRWVFR
jgi:putative flippase GtrA